MGSRWFNRLVKDCENISSHIRIKEIGNGFYRIYYNQAYIYEVYKEMPQIGYEDETKDFNFVSKKYIESREDPSEMVRKVKNFVEGYWEALATIRIRVWMMKHDKEFNEKATKRYQTVVIK